MSRELPGKVAFYTYAQLNITIGFPENRLCCRWCPLCKMESGLKRLYCAVTNELLVYPDETVGNRCPLKLLETEKENETCL